MHTPPYPQSKTDPWKHQARIWPTLLNMPAYYLAWEMGVGKSKIAVDYNTGVNAQKTIILCPKNTVHVWPRQFDLHCGRNVLIYAPEKKLSAAKKAAEIKAIINKHNGPAVIVINFESSWRPPLGPLVHVNKKTKRRQTLKPGLLETTKWDMQIIDEAHRIKSPSGTASWQAFRIARNSLRKLYLSGTPMPHSPLDIYAQYRALNPRIFGTRFSDFRARYAVMGGHLGKQIFRFQNIEELNKRFFSCADEVLLDDALDIPDRQNHYINIDLPPGVLKKYKELEKQFWIEWGKGEVTVSNALVKFLRLSQMARGILKFDDGREEIVDSTIIDAVADFTEDLPPNEQLVVFTKFKPELKKLKVAIEKTGRSVAELSGDMNQRKLWENKDKNTLVAQIDAGAESADYTQAKYCLYCSTGIKLGTYRQSRRRLRRPGQKRKTHFYHFIANKTIDVTTHRALKDRKDVVDFVLRGLHEYKKTGVNPKLRMISDIELSTLK